MKKFYFNLKIVIISVLAVCILCAGGVAAFVAFGQDSFESPLSAALNDGSGKLPNSENLNSEDNFGAVEAFTAHGDIYPDFTNDILNANTAFSVVNALPAAENTADLKTVSAHSMSANTPSLLADDELIIDSFRFPFGIASELKSNNTVTDSLRFSGDSRAHLLTVENRGTLRLRFSFGSIEATGTPWIVYLYENYSSDGSDNLDSYRIITRFNIGASTDSASSETVGLYPGKYIVVVTTGNVVSTAKYTLTAEFKNGIAWEAEPNDTVTRYNELGVNVKVGGASSDKIGGDTDIFMLTLPKKGIVNIIFEHSDEKLPQVGWIVTLADLDGNIIYQTRSYYKDTVIESGEIGLDKGNYSVTVESHILSAVDYYITCNYEVIDTYETELNDTPETANSIPVNSDGGGISGSLTDKTTVADRDYYYFDLESAGVVSFRFIHRDYIRDRDGWNISLVDSNGKVYYRAISRWKDMSVVSPQIGLDKGRYYLIVSSENMLLNSGTYILGVTYAAGDNWESEDNNTLETADVLPLNTEIFGALVNSVTDYDVDNYVFELNRTTAVKFIFSHNAAEQDYNGWKISVYNENGTRINYFSSKWSDGSISTDLMNLGNGKYYITVETGERFNEGKYSITVQTGG